ncbi:LaeA-like regulator of secondary metabolism, putative [Aspergillus udagawae]|nr:LaeA-like regulator of secondary metabolism, putative [Aspergillus udagawae]
MGADEIASDYFAVTVANLPATTRSWLWNGHPHNCRFHAPFDFEFPWKKLGEESWDVIRLQVCGGSVVNWPSLYRRVIAHLRPDAWFEQVDIDFEPKCEDRTVGGSALYNWYCKLSQATSDAARPISHQFQATIDHLRNAGFTDVEHKQFILPLNKWHPDSRMRSIGRWYGRTFFESIEPLSLAPLCRILGWTPGEVRHLVSDAKSELLDLAVHTFHVLHIYTARRDTPSSVCASLESDLPVPGRIVDWETAKLVDWMDCVAAGKPPRASDVNGLLEQSKDWNKSIHGDWSAPCHTKREKRFSSFPAMFVASINGCTTTDDVDVRYQHLPPPPPPPKPR